MTGLIATWAPFWPHLAVGCAAAAVLLLSTWLAERRGYSRGHEIGVIDGATAVALKAYPSGEERLMAVLNAQVQVKRDD